MESQNKLKQLNTAIEDLQMVRDDVANEELTNAIKRNIFYLSTELFRTSKVENYFWNFCSFSVYENHYAERLENYLVENDNLIVDEESFIQQELNNNQPPLSYWYVNLFNPEIVEEIKLMTLKKEKFLKEKLLNLSDLEAIELDFDSEKISAKEKMVYLHQLGVIDFLLNKQPFRTTANSLANVLASILEEKRITIQPILSAIVSENEENKNHPLYTKSTLDKVNQHLINIGFNPNKTN